MKKLNEPVLGKLMFAISFYGNGNMVYNSYDYDNGRFRPEEPITEKTYALLREEFGKKDRELKDYYFKGVIPRNVVKYNQKQLYVAWVTEAGMRNHLFSPGIDIESKEYPVPRLLWIYDGALDVYALRGMDKIDNDTKIFQAPFFNVSGGGDVCLGTMKIIKNEYDYAKIMQSVEDAFFGSYFTHTSTDKLLNMNIVQWYKEGYTWFHDELLYDINKTIKDVLR